MGWFLPSERSLRQRPQRQRLNQPLRQPPTPSQGQGWNPLRTLLICQIVGWALFLALIAALWLYGKGYLANYVGKTQTPPRTTVLLVEAPRWMSPRLANHLREVVLGTIEPNPLDSNSLQAAEKALAADPWVQSVRLVRQRDGTISVYAAYRQPAAVIARDDGFHIVDSTAHTLPGVYNAQQMPVVQLPILAGVAAEPPTEGQVWPGDDLQAGLKLALMLETDPTLMGQVAQIDLRNFDGRADRNSPHLVLLATGGGLVRWGRAPGQEGIYEPAAGIKLANLRHIVQQSGSIDAGGRIVDLFLDTPLIHPRADNPEAGDAPAKPGAGE